MRADLFVVDIGASFSFSNRSQESQCHDLSLMDSLFQITGNKSACASADRTTIISPSRNLGGDERMEDVGRSRKGRGEGGFKGGVVGRDAGGGDGGGDGGGGAAGDGCEDVAGIVGSVASKGAGHIKETGQGSNPFAPCTPGTMSFESGVYVNAGLQVLSVCG